ncbi:MAG: response regulator [Paracoccaceae bacterium]
MSDPITPQILIVDDARDIREPLGQYLRRQGFRVRLAADAAEARAILSGAAVHLAVLDVMMPGEDGLSLCRSLVREGRVPVILLTALASESDRIAGLELGADDYLCKPFNPRELVARIRSVLRRSPPGQQPSGTGRRRFGDLVHDALAHTVTLPDGASVKLTTGENRLLATFLDHPGDILTRMRLLDLIRGREARAYDRAVDNAVSRLRRKIGDDVRSPRIILTEWGGGYRLAAPVETLA